MGDRFVGRFFHGANVYDYEMPTKEIWFGWYSFCDRKYRVFENKRSKNKNYPNKFCWYSDSLTPGFQRKRITIEYMKKFLSKFQFTLGINAGFVFGLNTTKLKSGTVVNGRKVVSVYDIVDDNNKPTIPNWLKCWDASEYKKWIILYW